MLLNKMNMKRDFLKVLLIAILPMCVVSCIDNVPEEEILPRDAVSFEYYIDQKSDSVYYLDYYIDSYITFVNTSPETTTGTVTWEFGENAVFDPELQGKDTVTCYYTMAGTYKVKLTIGDKSREQVIMIAPIKPIVSAIMTDAICEVQKTLVDFNVELPNPQNKPATFVWTFPVGTKDANGNEVLTYESTSPADVPVGLQFSHVGSQQVKLAATLGGLKLEDATLNVQVGYNKEVPTLYYAVQGGRIMAYKLTDADKPADMIINPFDLGVASGQHPFTLLFHDTLLYVLDAGKQFYYVNDENGVLGDGKISVISKDGSKVQTMISNAGQAAFDDPFYGCILDDGNLYYANRNTGIIKVSLKDRDKMYSATEFPYYIEHNKLGYYNNGWSYGAIGGSIAKINGTWYWAKFYNGNGIYRFKDKDRLPDAIQQGDASNKPNSGILLEGTQSKSFVYASKSDVLCLHIMDVGYNGLYAATIKEIEAVGGDKVALLDYEIKYSGTHVIDGEKKILKDLSFCSNTTGNLAAVEGTGSESVGICQLAYDQNSNCVYFAYRNNSKDNKDKDGGEKYPPTGIYCYNVATRTTTCLLEGVSAYGIVVNNAKSKLF